MKSNEEIAQEIINLLKGKTIKECIDFLETTKKGIIDRANQLVLSD